MKTNIGSKALIAVDTNDNMIILCWFGFIFRFCYNGHGSSESIYYWKKKTSERLKKLFDFSTAASFSLYCHYFFLSLHPCPQSSFTMSINLPSSFTFIIPSLS